MADDDLDRLLDEVRSGQAADTTAGGNDDGTRTVMSAMRDAFRSHTDDELARHPHAVHLERVAREGPTSLPEGLGWIEGHLATCEICRRACDAARATLQAEARDAERASLWSWMSRTVFHPALAAAYLILLVLVGGWELSRGPRPVGTGSEPTGVQLAPQLVFADPLLRSADDAASTLEFPSSALDAPTVHLVLQTDRDGLDDPSRRYRISIREGDVSVWETEFDGTRFSALGVAAVVLPADLFDGGQRYRLVLVDDASGSTMLERSFEFTE